MNKNPNSLTRLTEFEPHSDDIKPAGNFFYRLFKRTGSTAQQRDKDPFVPVLRDVADDDETDGDDANQDNNVVEAESRSETSVSSVPSPVTSLQPPPERTLSSVLKRLSRIVVGSTGQSLQEYKDSDFKQYWMPDSNCHQCYECGLRFSTLKRRHHCRICGQIFCHSCCSQQVPGKIVGYTGYLRACTYCCKVVLQYVRRPSSRDEVHQSVDEEEQCTDDLASVGSPTTEAALLESPSRTASLSSSLNIQQRRPSKSLRPSSIFDEDAKQRPCSRVIPEDLQVENSGLLQDTSWLNDLWQSMYHSTDGVDVRRHRHRLYTYTDCMLGRDIVDWLVSNNKASTRDQAAVLGQALIDGKWMISIGGHDVRFRDDHTVYRPFQALRSSQSAMSLRDEPAELTSLPQVSDDDDDDGPLWVKEIPQDDKDDDLNHVHELPCSASSSELATTNPSVFYVDSPMFVGSLQPPQKEPASAHVSCATKQATHHMSGSSSLSHSSVEVGLMPALQRAATPEVNVSEMSTDAAAGGRLESFSESDENNEQAIRERFSKLHMEHLTALVNQLLNNERLSTAAVHWADMLLSISRKISQTVRPDIRNDADDMDIRQYVIIKTIPGGTPADTAVVNGLVCTKSVAHRKMHQDIVNPRILLLRSSIEYQRVENKFSSLEPQILQEHEYLHNCVGRIAALQPDILLVEKTVSRLAQGFLLDANITLVLNVKPGVMERIARFTQATIVSSIDGLVKQTTMGACQHFYMRTHQLPDGTTKSLMYFDGCAKNLGCTVTLRGSLQTPELRAMKNILRFMTYAMYNGRLESAFLFDELAAPPDPASLTTATACYSPTSVCDSEVDMVPLPANLPKFVSNVSTGVDIQSENIVGNGPQFNTVDGSCGDVDFSTSCSQQPKSELVLMTGNTDSLSHVDADSRETVEPVLGYEQTSCKLAGGCNELVSEQDDDDDEVRQREAAFHAALSQTLLSVSPCSQVHLPYLETVAGTRCRLRRHFPAKIYWSPRLNSAPPTNDAMTPTSDVDNVAGIRVAAADIVMGVPSVVDLLPVHPFIVEKLTAPSSAPTVQALLSDYRARGGRLPLPTSKSAVRRKEEEQRTEELAQSSSASAAGGGDGTRKLPDCLDAFNHQRFLVLFSSFSQESANAPLPCVAPWVVSMEYYGRNDVTLGGFLERYCFREMYQCSNRMCETPMTQHIRRFVHGTGCLQVIMRKLDIPMAGTADTIYTWTYCRKCRESSSVSMLSTDAWSLSFAKYLELRFHASLYIRRSTTTVYDDSDIVCSHSIHHDHHQYFGCQSVVASFRYSTITLNEVAFPGLVINILPLDITLQQLEDDGKMLHYQTNAVFMAVLEQLHRLKKEVPSELQSAAVTDNVIDVEEEQECVTQKVEYMQSLIQNMKKIPPSDTSIYLQVQDAFVCIKRQVAELVMVWNDRIHDFEVQMKKSADRKVSQAGGAASSRPIHITDSQSQLSADDESDFSVISDSVVEEAVADVTTRDDEPQVSPPLPPATSSAAGGTQLSEIETSFGSRGSAAASAEQTVSAADSITATSTNDSTKSAAKSKVPTDVKRPAKPVNRDTSELEKKDRTATVKQMFSSLLSSTGNTTVQIPFPADEHHLLPACQKVPVVVYDQEPSSVIAYALSSQDYEVSLQQLRMQISAGGTSSVQKLSMRPPASASSSSSAPGQTVASSNSVEPSGKKSVLSFLKGSTSSSRDRSPSQRGRLQRYEVDMVKYTPRSGERDSLEDSEEVNDGGSVTTDGQKSLSKSARQQQQQPVNHHIELQFSDNTAKFYCRVCFADQFIKLRKLIFPDGEERYIRSLSRCFTWLARGGKSGSSFCKTQDDRFILKQMSRYEVQSFSEFAPHYFQYITSAHAHNKPTALAKIVGVYKIGYQNSKTGAAMKQDLLVMENLFYSRNISRIFDLKGSARNRLVSTSGKRVEDLVLLDENLLKVSVDSPLYVHPHSKAVLTSAITHDTQFLADHSVMDYSLLVGCDCATNELVVGIIDYIRTFTWDKMLEMVLKKNIIGAMPTVVSPELYRRRFLESMDRYFLCVPDRWTGHGRGMVT